MLKRTATLLSFLFVSGMLFAQQPSWKDMAEDLNYNVYDVIDAAEKYYTTHPKGPGSGYKGYMRWRYVNEANFYPTGDRSNFRPDQLYFEYNKAKSDFRPRAAGEHWRFMGPDYATNLLTPSYASGVGRVEAVWADFATADTIFMGARNGGFWRTYDGGSTWESTTQDLPAVGVVDIEVNPNDHSEVWIVTRHAAGYSLGLLHSTNYGSTWNTTSLSLSGNSDWLYDLYIAPTNTDTMYLSANSGFWRSVDGGSNWNNMLSGRVRSLAVNPANSQQVYIVRNAARDDVRVSNDGGQNFTGTTNVGGNSNSVPRLYTTPDNPAVLYFASSSGIWKSPDNGSSFVLQGSAPTGMMTFGVSDTDEDLCIFGSLDQYISTNSGQSWTLFAPWANASGANYVHADGRVLRSWNGVLWLGTDGYLAKSTNDGANWTRVNNSGTGIREFYRIGTSVSRTSRVVAGSQDNGTSILIDSTWYEWFGGDGMDCHQNWTIPDIWFGNWQYGGMRKTMNNGVSITSAKPQTSNGDWVTPTVLDRLNESTIFAGFDSLYKSTDHGDTWTLMESFAFLGNLKHLTIAPSDSNYLYAARNSRIFRSSDNGDNWTEISSGLPNRNINRIAVHTSDPQHIAVIFAGYGANEKVYESTDGGNNWTNLSSGLPNIPGQAAVWQANANDRLWIGMDGGIWYRDNLSSGWVAYVDSLPVQPIRDLEILHGANVIRCGLFGRGVWEASLPGKAAAPRITWIDIDPAVHPLNRPTALDSVHIRAIVSGPNPMSAVDLEWGFDGVNFPNIISMSQVNGDTFRTEEGIPPHVVGTQVYFRVNAIDTDSEFALSEGIVYRVKEAILCAGGGSNGTGSDWISQVSLNTLSNSSGQSSYTNYASTIYTSLVRQGNYTLSVSLNAAFPCDSVFAWIDWDNNLSFDASEQLIFTTLNTFNAATATFTVPNNAVLDTVVMRVRNIYDCNGAPADPCNIYAGEVEDYGIIINTSVGRSGPLGPEVAIFPNPADKSVLVQCQEPISSFRLLDLQGKELSVRTSFRSDRELELDVADLPANVYFLEIKLNEDKVVRKLLVEHH